MKRVLTAIALFALALYLIFWAADWGFMVAAVCMGLLCYWEFAGLVVAHGISRPGVIGALSGLVLLLGPDWLQGEQILAAVFVLMMLAFVAALRFGDQRGILAAVGSALLGAFYTFLPWRFSVDLRRESVHLVFFALALNWIGDTAAYYSGRTFGRHKLAPSVSPNKSWEGAAASVVASIAFGLFYLGYFVSRVPWWEVIALAGLGNVAGQLGDLAESAMKRGAGVKDSGSLLPGHGGMLDRVDSSLFALPTVYVSFALIAWLQGSPPR